MSSEIILSIKEHEHKLIGALHDYKKWLEAESNRVEMILANLKTLIDGGIVDIVKTPTVNDKSIRLNDLKPETRVTVKVRVLQAIKESGGQLRLSAVRRCMYKLKLDKRYDSVIRDACRQLVKDGELYRGKDKDNKSVYRLVPGDTIKVAESGV